MAETFYDDSTVNAQWSTLKTSIRKATLGQLGEILRHKRDWISDRTLQLFAKARDARLINSPEFRIFRRLATRSAKGDRKQYWEAIADNMEAATVAADIVKLFRLIRVAAGKRQTSEPLLRSTTGQLIQETEQKIQRWVEHFDGLLNRPSNQAGSLQVSSSSETYDTN
ncbi:unnamed protein product [Echinostoma caproni]|uniref:Transposase n=1 Tax=Echinostoma caproni TaxID=27848 RepID=A0A183A1K5_9TREM|nr:unnamed protein product [Echinostoma caproni]